MTAPLLALATLCILLTAIHVTSIAVVIWRFRRGRRPITSSESHPPVSLVRPLCGIDSYGLDTLRSSFTLEYPNYEILFCVASADDPVVPLVEALIAKHSAVEAKLLIGEDYLNSNPKLNNVAKGWRAAAHGWVVIADSNVLMPPDYIQQLFACWRSDTGLVASPPVGCCPEGFWAGIECAFLNTYQARWQYVADAFGFGFAQGKTMLWRRADLERAGGIAALAREVAEDAAATKVVRGAGLQVRLVARPFAQPLGRRSAAEVWSRQVRWARLRRASFVLYFLPEVFSGGVLPLVGLAIVARNAGLPAMTSAGVFATFWYGGEMLLAASAGWPVSGLSPLYSLTRDLLLPLVYFKALCGSGFVWRGNEMRVNRIGPNLTLQSMRPRLGKLTLASRRRLHALRARTSSAANRFAYYRRAGR